MISAIGQRLLAAGARRELFLVFAIFNGTFASGRYRGASEGAGREHGGETMAERLPTPAELFDLTGRVALVTGGAGGLGRAIAAGLAGAGAMVAIGDLDRPGAERAAEAIKRAGGQAMPLPLDVTDADSVQAATDRLLTEAGRIDVLVNSHGITQRVAAEDFPHAAWDRIIGINLTGVFLCCQSVGRVMLRQGKGSIISLTSIGGLVALPTSVAYCASKGGVVQLTRTMGVEWAARGVRVNAIAPCTVNTPLIRAVLDAEPEYRERVIGKIPAGRAAEPEEYVGAALFLASDASAMVTGTILSVDGGYVAQ
jgi:NAD(P)-dependent dehydrogenase (short-subunit alcohol dehydrogenase family)